MNVGRSPRCLPHRNNNLMQPLRNVSCRVKAGNCCLRVIVNIQRTHVIRVSAKCRCQAGPIPDAERRVHHVEPVESDIWFTRRIPISSIDVGERLRAVKQAKVGGIAASIKEFGLIHPIAVSTPDLDAPDARYLLEAGFYRLEAYKFLGLTHIDARVVVGVHSRRSGMTSQPIPILRTPLS